MTELRKKRSQSVIDGAPESVKGTLREAFSGSASPRKAIKAMCLACVGFERDAVRNCTRPKDGKPRNRLATQVELDRLAGCASEDLRRAIVIAVETGMRAGEIASNPAIRGRVAVLLDSKNNEGREVPLSAKALEALQSGVNLTAGSISSLFARLCREERIKGLTFHDLRHLACVRLSERLDLMELCKMMGWKDPRHALVYYSKGAEAIADKL